MKKATEEQIEAAVMGRSAHAAKELLASQGLAVSINRCDTTISFMISEGRRGKISGGATFAQKMPEKAEKAAIHRGCDRLHRATLNLYAKMANERQIDITTAMLHAQHGREMVDSIGRAA